MSEKVYITPQGASNLRAELQYLWRDKRPKITQQVSAAAALGDRSENADYIYGKKRLREIDKRIRYLTKRLDNLEIVDRKPPDQEAIYFGAWIKLEDETGSPKEIRIVGADEFDLARGWISLDSPVSKALFGKRKGDDVVINTPEGKQEWYIEDVSYDDWGQV